MAANRSTRLLAVAAIAIAHTQLDGAAAAVYKDLGEGKCVDASGEEFTVVYLGLAPLGGDSVAKCKAFCTGVPKCNGFWMNTGNQACYLNGGLALTNDDKPASDWVWQGTQKGEGPVVRAHNPSRGAYRCWAREGWEAPPAPTTAGTVACETLRQSPETTAQRASARACADKIEGSCAGEGEGEGRHGRPRPTARVCVCVSPPRPRGVGAARAKTLGRKLAGRCTLQLHVPPSSTPFPRGQPWRWWRAGASMPPFGA